jgi:hypothetical protein
MVCKGKSLLFGATASEGGLSRHLIIVINNCRCNSETFPQSARSGESLFVSTIKKSVSTMKTEQGSQEGSQILAKQYQPDDNHYEFFVIETLVERISL